MTAVLCRGGNYLPRPVKQRKIGFMPVINKFGPLDPQAAQGENALKLDELEAIRLKDMEGLEQEACADRMEISRPTFQRILLSARSKIADSLIYGRSIRIEGGSYTRGNCLLHCLDCGHEWEGPVENPVLTDKPDTGRITVPDCPECHSRRWACVTDKNQGDRDACRQSCPFHARN